MEAQGTYRQAGETGDGGGTSSVVKHVGIQNQVLKWLQDFSDRLEERAKGASAEVNGLLDEAVTLELDMKTAAVSFDNLTRQRFTEHKISDEGNANLKTSGRQRSMQSQVPAQDYERDILPRYKEALHIGLSSCKDHFRKKGRSTTSVFRAMSSYGPLPHIIGSEEYNHDNNCGLPDDAQPLTDDFSWLRESQGESLDSELLGSPTLGLQQGFGKGETDSLVSVTREFKAMLEAALVNPYKFYDNVSPTARDASIDNSRPSELHHSTEPVLLDSIGGSPEADDNAEEAGLLASLQDPDSNAHDIYSALVREGLFDTGDEILSIEPVEPAETSVSDPALGSPNAAVPDSAECTLSTNESISDKEKTLIESDDTESQSEQNDGVSRNSNADIN